MLIQSAWELLSDQWKEAISEHINENIRLVCRSEDVSDLCADILSTPLFSLCTVGGSCRSIETISIICKDHEEIPRDQDQLSDEESILLHILTQDTGRLQTSHPELCPDSLLAAHNIAVQYKDPRDTKKDTDIDYESLWKQLLPSDRQEILEWVSHNILIDEKKEATYEVVVVNYKNAMYGKEHPEIDSGDLYETHERKLVSWTCHSCEREIKVVSCDFDTIFSHIIGKHISEIIPDFDERLRNLFETYANDAKIAV
jgi:hypothetical protein